LFRTVRPHECDVSTAFVGKKPEMAPAVASLRLRVTGIRRLFDLA
jgi:hypothetical protein